MVCMTSTVEREYRTACSCTFYYCCVVFYNQYVKLAMESSEMENTSLNTICEQSTVYHFNLFRYLI